MHLASPPNLIWFGNYTTMYTYPLRSLALCLYHRRVQCISLPDSRMNLPLTYSPNLPYQLIEHLLNPHQSRPHLRRDLHEPTAHKLLCQHLPLVHKDLSMHVCHIKLIRYKNTGRFSNSPSPRFYSTFLKLSFTRTRAVSEETL